MGAGSYIIDADNNLLPNDKDEAMSERLKLNKAKSEEETNA